MLLADRRPPFTPTGTAINRGACGARCPALGRRALGLDGVIQRYIGLLAGVEASAALVRGLPRHAIPDRIYPLNDQKEVPCHIPGINNPGGGGERGAAAAVGGGSGGGR